MEYGDGGTRHRRIGLLKNCVARSRGEEPALGRRPNCMRCQFSADHIWRLIGINILSMLSPLTSVSEVLLTVLKAIGAQILEQPPEMETAQIARPRELQLCCTPYFVPARRRFRTSPGYHKDPIKVWKRISTTSKNVKKNRRISPGLASTS
jgi:hypothetical protein